MPELPEVETIAQTLQHGNGSPPLPGQRIKRVTIRWPRHIAMPSVTTFRRRIQGRTIKEVDRRGKYLVFPSRLVKRRRVLKPLLMDQTFLAGLGNIYTDEALHHARLHPLRCSDSLDMNEITALWQGIRDALNMGLHHNGASIDWVYRGGEFQHHFRVYGRSGEPCLRCGTSIERIIVGQRGTHFCPTCQGKVDV